MMFFFAPVINSKIWLKRTTIYPIFPFLGTFLSGCSTVTEKKQQMTNEKEKISVTSDYLTEKIFTFCYFILAREE